jgi:hypothetical protein
VEKRGERLVWLYEMGEIATSPVLGRLKVRLRDLYAIDPAIAWRAKLTSSDDPEAELEAVRNGTGPTPDSEYVWLGVQRHRQSKWNRHSPTLPVWANGVEIVEAEEPIGTFGAVGYATVYDQACWEWAKDYYVELLVREY